MSALKLLVDVWYNESFENGNFLSILQECNVVYYLILPIFSFFFIVEASFCLSVYMPVLIRMTLN